MFLRYQGTRFLEAQLFPGERERERERDDSNLYDLEIACLRVGCQLIINLLIHLSIRHTIR